MVGVSSLAAVGGVVGAGVLLTQHQTEGAHAASNDQGDARKNQAIRNILNIAATAETLAVVFYTEAWLHADRLGLRATSRLDIRAALIEEQMHLKFLQRQGAKALTNKFSFPFGIQTFENIELFLRVQQQLEAAFVAAYLAAVKEFAQWGRADLAQMAGQIAAIEAEHRVIGRVIGAQFPANNEAFAPLLLKAVADAPTFLKNAGYLTPMNGNSFLFNPAATNWDAVTMTNPTVMPATPVMAHLKF
ncbi:hypothetical protein KDI_40190 [Dictyobacter arantiisoli]|uniref:Ferritin-like domain-containing protein n=1 Tax=Dictyobacter arantiisoli TaxID=2014874 RepID=A0A5A5TGU7_9CHLR|nr:hypothetical protein KDI_40190 [Dictyobacter arantiisoli]